jgi:hypothetical protein
LLDGTGRAASQFHHGDDRGNADDDAEAGEHRAHDIAPESPQGHTRCASGVFELAGLSVQRGAWRWREVRRLSAIGWLGLHRRTFIDNHTVLHANDSFAH